ncbi:MAG: hypothetical protein CMH93_05655 [Oceanicaulis sp.]|uniref:Uncharacterized protein n=1 Tax=Maricaulis virginensis TaxID=144022 RepID=A0A9W6IQA4_9PROT|nr:hypothetical protein [Maricaulis virginensis]MAC38998.1 hypothetical protein [Oceanicaulis sp.]GLK53692.1 hypothetical protein GCM10017621_32000 [Maricaulis virginensis]
MTTIRSAYSVPTPTRRRVEPAGRARGSSDHPPRQDRALVTVPTRQKTDGDAERSFVRTRPATAEVMVQIIGGDIPRRGIKADPSEVERFRRTYAQAAQPSAPAPKWERRA